MCAVSAIYDYGKTIPYQNWENEEMRRQFQELVKRAMEFDRKTNQPNCEDPEKMKWWSAVEEAHK